MTNIELIGPEIQCKVHNTFPMGYNKKTIPVIIIEQFHSCLFHMKFSNVLLLRMTPLANDIIVDYQCGFTFKR